MAATSEELFAKLDQMGITYETHQHDPVFTVEEAQAVHRDLAGGHSKNLFLKDKNGDLYLLVCLEDTVVNLKSFRKLVGAKNLSFGKPELLKETLGIDPGSVTPFSLINDAAQTVTVVLEARMMEMDMLNFHPLINSMTTQISSQDLRRFISDCGHAPIIVNLDNPD
ncbi:prolyl-tRNA synthetase associated domain-containing protein [Sneathiella marina]|uniref:Prolyl-tRNA synthetase associated domain-containing protein n=1 Tax=Sneathiella marina TaxID=2950108 RepID=A0ABY4W740_9PROT|nr:prolyl-tRNA synthetase associated domain-containing protein [Sneathiella marina]USG61570.1 prolyl-tRNA synthetase associated domain-containing protein [Sneathiella marina]